MTTYFYRNADCVSALGTSQRLTIFRDGARVLAFQARESERSKTHVTACDAHHSLVSNSAAVPGTMAFDAYGYSSSGESLPVAFKGERFDAISGCYWLGMGYRAYLPILRRFDSPDDASPFARGGINAYAFVSGDPVNFGDPTGRWRRPHIIPRQMTDGPLQAFGASLPDYPGAKQINVSKNSDGMTVIVGHGNKEAGTIGGYTPQALLAEMKKNHIELSKGPIHLISCSAGSKGSSYASPLEPVGQRLANLMNTPVTTYKKTVSVHIYRDEHNQPFRLVNAPTPYSNAEPITFYPSMGARISHFFDRLFSAVWKVRN